MTQSKQFRNTARSTKLIVKKKQVEKFTNPPEKSLAGKCPTSPHLPNICKVISINLPRSYTFGSSYCRLGETKKIYYLALIQRHNIQNKRQMHGFLPGGHILISTTEITNVHYLPTIDAWAQNNCCSWSFLLNSKVWNKCVENYVS